MTRDSALSHETSWSHEASRGVKIVRCVTSIDDDAGHWTRTDTETDERV